MWDVVMKFVCFADRRNSFTLYVASIVISILVFSAILFFDPSIGLPIMLAYILFAIYLFISFKKSLLPEDSQDSGATKRKMIAASLVFSTLGSLVILPITSIIFIVISLLV